MLELNDDDSAYLDWAERHPDGYVLNSTRPPMAGYLILHRATCRLVARPQTGGRSWTRGMIKICAVDRAELEAFGAGLGGNLQPCGSCLA